jgi:hypothetical protein
MFHVKHLIAMLFSNGLPHALSGLASFVDNLSLPLKTADFSP